MNEQVHYINGKFVTEDQLVISARDLGFTRGFVVFEALRTYAHHKPFMLSRHLDRLFQSAKIIGLHIPWSKEQLTTWVYDTLGKNGRETNEQIVKVTITGGVSSTMLQSSAPTIIITIDPIQTLPHDLYAFGASLITVEFSHYNLKAKTNNYSEGVKQAEQAQIQGALEPLFYDQHQVYECSKSSLFAVIENKLCTPKSHVLKGITREILLSKLCLEIPVIERDFTIDELFTAKEVFITASVKEIVPIVKIDDIRIGDGQVGRITKEAMTQYQTFIQSGLWLS